MCLLLAVCVEWGFTTPTQRMGESVCIRGYPYSGVSYLWGLITHMGVDTHKGRVWLISGGVGFSYT